MRARHGDRLGSRHLAVVSAPCVLPVPAGLHREEPRYGGLGLWLSIVRELSNCTAASDRPESGPRTQLHVRRLAPRHRRSRTEQRHAVRSRRREPGRALRPAARGSRGQSRTARARAVARERPCFGVRDGRRGICGARARPAYVIVADIGLPGEDGYSFIRRVRAHTSAPVPRAGHRLTRRDVATARALASLPNIFRSRSNFAFLVRTIRELSSRRAPRGALDTSASGT